MDDPRCIISLRETIANCATFRRLCGNVDVATARNSVHYHLTFDEIQVDPDDDDPDPADPERQPLDPFPRALVIDMGPQTTAIPGSISPFAGGMLEAFFQFKQFTKEELDSWYGVDVGEPTLRDHWKHADNIKVALRKEMIALSRAAGCLTIIRLAEEVTGLIDPKTMNGLDVWEIDFFAFWEGLP